MNVFAILECELNWFRYVYRIQEETTLRGIHSNWCDLKLDVCAVKSKTKSFVLYYENKIKSFLARILVNLDLPCRLFNQFNSPFVHEFKKKQTNAKKKKRRIHNLTFKAAVRMLSRSYINTEQQKQHNELHCFHISIVNE